MSGASSYARAAALFRAGDLAGAEAALTPLDACSFDAVHLLAGVKRARGDELGALNLFDAAISLKPDSAVAHRTRAGLLLSLGRFAEAAEGYKDAAAFAPEHAQSWYNRARALAMLDRNEEALSAYVEASKLAPDDADIAVDYGAALQALGRTDDARAQFEGALKSAPGHAGATRGLSALHYNEGVALLRLGEFARGFTLYEARRAAGVIDTPALDRGRAQWDGAQLDGVLHLWAEMGIGEQVLFSRFIAEAKRRGKQVVLECDRRLAPLLQRAFDVKVVDAERGESVEAQAQCALASLPHVLAVTSADISGAAYLRADAERTRTIRARYEAAAAGRAIVGVAWASKNTVFGEQKSSRLSDWAPLLRGDYFFVNLQYGDVAADITEARRAFGCEIHCDPDIDQMRDLDSFAAQIAALDHVVCVSNTTVHMAGALGARCLVLTPPERRLLWYWGDAGATTPWYASLRLIGRAAGESDWSGQVGRAAALLRDASP